MTSGWATPVAAVEVIEEAETVLASAVMGSARRPVSVRARTLTRASGLSVATRTRSAPLASINAP